MKFFYHDSLDLVDPEFDFKNEKHSDHRVRHRDDVSAHELLDEAPYHGLLVSRSMVYGTEGNQPYRCLIVQTTLQRPLNRKAGQVLKKYQDTHPETPSFVLLNRWNEIIAYTRGPTWPGAALDVNQSPNTMPASRIKVLVYLLYVEHLIAQGKIQGRYSKRKSQPYIRLAKTLRLTTKNPSLGSRSGMRS